MSRPTIAITMGDASGIGPEIIMKALALPEVHEMCNPLVVGDAERLRTAGEIVGSSLRVDSLDDPAQARFAPDAVECVDLKLIRDPNYSSALLRFEYGKGNRHDGELDPDRFTIITSYRF